MLYHILTYNYVLNFYRENVKNRIKLQDFT